MHDPPAPTPIPSASKSASPAPPPPPAVPAPPVLKTPTQAEIDKNSEDAKAHGVPGSAPQAASTKKMADILPEHPKIEGGLAVVGSLKIDAAKYAVVREALIYEGKNPEMGTIVQRAIDGPRTTTITTNTVADNSMTPKASGDAEIAIDFTHMHIASNGARRSPATRLAHELSHADEWTHNPQRMLLNSSTPDDKFSDLEEKRVITGLERRNVNALGEGVREDHHHGKGNFEVKSVTSTTPVLHQTRDGVTTEIPANYVQTGKISAMDATSVTQEIGHGKTVTYPRAEFEGLVGTQALERAVASGKPMSVSVANNEYQMRDPAHQQGKEHAPSR